MWQIGIVRLLNNGHIAGAYGKLAIALGVGKPLQESDGGLLLFGRRLYRAYPCPSLHHHLLPAGECRDGHDVELDDFGGVVGANNFVGVIQNARRRANAGNRLPRPKGIGRIAASQPQASADCRARIRLPHAGERRAERDVVTVEKRRSERLNAHLEVIEVVIMGEKRLPIAFDIRRKAVGPFLVDATSVKETLPRSQTVKGYACCSGKAVEIGFVDEEQLC